jgi:hypothetical protein
VIGPLDSVPASHRAHDGEVSPDTEVLLVAGMYRYKKDNMVKTILATIVIFSFTSRADNRREVKYVHTREFVSPTDWIDSVSISPDTYIDVRYEDRGDGISVALLGCRVNGSKCDSPSQFRWMTK